MELESLLVVALLLAATLPLVLYLARSQSLARRVAVLGTWAALGGIVALGAETYRPVERSRRPITDRPLQVKADGYVSSDACQACHPREYGTWHRSYHRTMTQVATKDTVAGPTNGVSVHARGKTYVVQARGDEVWVEMEDPEWADQDAGARVAPRVWRQIVQTTGSHSEQFYWTATGKTRKLSLLPIMYRLLDEQRWSSLDGCCVTPPGSGQETDAGRWNRVCQRCHATRGQARVSGMDDMDTHVAELGIACEACHGPGEEHAELNRDPRRRYALHKKRAGDDSIVNPANLDNVRSSQVCGQCHCNTKLPNDEEYHRWQQEGYRYRPGDVLTDTREIMTDGIDRFWPDGMVRVSGREYNGLLLTPCYEAGEMSCLSCHAMHKEANDPRSLDEWADDQLKPGMRGDLACTQCHAEYQDEAKVVEHTFHPLDSEGSRCMNCHMSYTAYGLLKGIRSHQVSEPSVQESLETGRPNACNQCHLDKTLAWTAEHLAERYGIEPPTLSSDQERIAASILWTAEGDATQRVLMAWSFGWAPAREASGTDWMTPFLLALMRDPYFAVRMIAHRSMEQQPEFRVIKGYDSDDPQERMIEVTNPAYLAWTRAGQGRRQANPRLLINARGELDTSTFARLEDRRDNRPVILNE